MTENYTKVTSVDYWLPDYYAICVVTGETINTPDNNGQCKHSANKEQTRVVKNFSR